MSVLVSLFEVLFLFLIFSSSNITAQTSNADTDFSCSVNSSLSCDTYVTYRARPPNYLDLGSISDLLGVSRLNIAKATNLTSEDSELIPDQLLLVPIKCYCNGSHYFSNVTYQIKKGDSFYSVSIGAFENLTNYHVVGDMNPTLYANNLTVGVDIVFPLLCKCPASSDLGKGLQYLVTYVWQPGDDVFPVSTMFGASALDIVAANNYRNFTAAVCLPVLVPVKLPIVLQYFPSSPSSRKSKHPSIRVAVSSIMGAIVAVSLCLIVYIREKKRTLARNTSIMESSDLFQLKKNENLERKIIQDKLLPGLSGYLGKPILYDFNIMMEATMNLSETFKIGGSVYKAMIHDQVLAVKKTEHTSEELRILQKVNHANLVKLMGVSSDNDGNLFLVYEYAENGSLDKWLFPGSSSSGSGSVGLLNWNQRLHIALDVANALRYMHEHTQPSIVHRDIGTSNILLDSRFKAKIANFSIARQATNSMMLKVDVFAFGRVLLEPVDGALSLASLAMACTSEKSAERPKMTDIVFHLSFLTQSSFEMYGRCWTSGEAEGSVQIISPVNSLEYSWSPRNT